LDEIISLKGEIKLLKAVIAQLEGDTVAHEAELTIGRGEPVWSSRVTIRESVCAAAAKRMNGDVTPSPPPTNAGVASSWGGKKVALDGTSDAGFEVVNGRKSRDRRANRQRNKGVANPATAAAPAPLPVAVPVLSP